MFPSPKSFFLKSLEFASIFSLLVGVDVDIVIVLLFFCLLFDMSDFGKYKNHFASISFCV